MNVNLVALSHQTDDSSTAIIDITAQRQLLIGNIPLFDQQRLTFQCITTPFSCRTRIRGDSLLTLGQLNIQVLYPFAPMTPTPRIPEASTSTPACARLLTNTPAAIKNRSDCALYDLNNYL